MVNYILRSDIATDEDNRDFIVYGITALNDKGETVASIPDIFFDKRRAERFVDLCNAEKVPLVHLQLVAENQLYYTK